MSELVPSLVTTCSFKRGREYIAKMRVTVGCGGSRRLEVDVTDKCTGENWRSSYDAAYIENLTHRTGNYKQFDVFVAMLQSGLLNTSDCVALDLLTFEDLELLRTRRSDHSLTSTSGKASNRRYLILTYTVQFDRIHYPLPLEYCGPPDPVVLQATIRKLEAEIDRLHRTGVSRELQRRVEQLTAANRQLVEENRRLTSAGKDVRRLVAAVKTLEDNVTRERQSFRAQIQKLRAENASLRSRICQLTKVTRSPSPAGSKFTPPRSSQSRRSQRSKSPAVSGLLRRASVSPAGSIRSLKSQGSAKSHRLGAKGADLGNLESRIRTLGRMLKEGITLN